jgi:hypothetical protein
VYSKFKKKNSKKMKSPISMENARFYTSKCRASFKKWGCCRCTPQDPQPLAILQGPQKKKKKTQFFFEKNADRLRCEVGGRLLVASQPRGAVAAHPSTGPLFFAPTSFFFSSFPHFWALLIGSSTCPLDQTLPKNFKHP